jgi:hypothetical protein
MNNDGKGNNNNKGLHSSVKLSIASLHRDYGRPCSAGLAFYTITMREGMTIMSTPPFAPSDVYIITTAFFWTLIALLSIGLFALLKNLRKERTLHS